MAAAQRSITMEACRLRLGMPTPWLTGHFHNWRWMIATVDPWSPQDSALVPAWQRAPLPTVQWPSSLLALMGSDIFIDPSFQSSHTGSFAFSLIQTVAQTTFLPADSSLRRCDQTGQEVRAASLLAGGTRVKAICVWRPVAIPAGVRSLTWRIWRRWNICPLSLLNQRRVQWFSVRQPRASGHSGVMLFWDVFELKLILVLLLFFLLPPVCPPV